MEVLDESFKINYENAKSNDKSIIKGSKYRITVLSDSLIRLEYSDTSYFEDRPTELAINRNFPTPQFEYQENDKFLVILTKYFKLQYAKEKPFVGSTFAPDTNLRVSLNGTDKVWYYGHDEARNFMGVVDNLDTKKPYMTTAEIQIAEKNKAKIVNKQFKLKGLYSTDGFATIDDSKSLVLLENGSMVKNETPRIDIYLFMYKRDFGKCLQDYFKLSGYPPLISRYLLGVWWNKTKAYKIQDIKNLILDFNRYRIPLSVLLLGDSWHIKDFNNMNRYKSGYTFNNDLIPNPEELVNYLHDRGVRV